MGQAGNGRAFHFEKEPRGLYALLSTEGGSAVLPRRTPLFWPSGLKNLQEESVS